VLKEDLPRTGSVDESALTDNLDGEIKPKSYFIFSFDQKPLTELGAAALQRPPEEIALSGGPWELRRTIVSVRVNPASPYRIDGDLRLSLDGRELAEVTLPPMPEYYRHTLSNGKTVMETAPTTSGATWSTSPCCGSAEYLARTGSAASATSATTGASTRGAGRPYTGVKPVETCRVGADRPLRRATHAYTLTGGWSPRGRRNPRRVLRPLRTGDRGAVPRPLDRRSSRRRAKADAQRQKAGIRSTTRTTRSGTGGLLADLARQTATSAARWHRRILDAPRSWGRAHPELRCRVEMARRSGSSRSPRRSRRPSKASTTSGPRRRPGSTWP
jgi:hypothetical protein